MSTSSAWPPEGALARGRRRKKRGKGGKGGKGARVTDSGESEGDEVGGDIAAGRPGVEHRAQAAFTRLKPRADVLGLSFLHMLRIPEGGGEGEEEEEPLSIAQLDALQEAHIRALAALADAKAREQARQEAANDAERWRIEGERRRIVEEGRAAGTSRGDLAGGGARVPLAGGPPGSWAALVREP